MLASLLREARNKLLAHNNLATILAGHARGQFPVGADIEYFKGLQELVDLVAGERRPFSNLMRDDAQVFVEALARGSRPNR